MRQLEFVIVDHCPVVKTSSATPHQEHCVSLDRRLQFDFGEYTALGTLLRKAERNGPIWAHRKANYRSASRATVTMFDSRPARSLRPQKNNVTTKTARKNSVREWAFAYCRIGVEPDSANGHDSTQSSDVANQNVCSPNSQRCA